MDKSRQKYLINLLDSYSKPLKKRAMAFIIIYSLATVFQVYALTKLLDILVTKFSELTSNYHLFGILLGASIVKAFSIYKRTQDANRIAAEIKSFIRGSIVNRVEVLGAKGLGQNTIDLSIIYIEQVENLNNYIARFYPQAIVARIAPIIIVSSIFCFNWVAGLILVLTAPLLPIFMILIGLKTAELNSKNLKQLQFLGNQFHDKLAGITTIISYNQELKTSKDLAKRSIEYTNSTLDLLKVAFLNSAVLEFLSSICIALMAVYFGLSYIEHNEFGGYGTAISLFSGFFCLTLAGEFFQPFKDLGTFYHDRSSALTAIDIIERFINNEPQDNLEFLYNNYDSAQHYQKSDLVNNSVKLEIKRSSDDMYGGKEKLLHPNQRTVQINIKVPFSGKNLIPYLSDDTKIIATNFSVKTNDDIVLLESVDFEFSLNEKIGLIGLSGSGKTTLISAILGLYNYSGSLTIGGIELSDISREHYYSYISWLGQNPNLFTTTLLDNISYEDKFLKTNVSAKPIIIAQDSDNRYFAEYLLSNSLLSQLSIEEAVELSGSTDIIRTKGVDFKVKHNNIGLSGGQVQRISLARALSKPHMLLIIDEPTANVDSSMEELLIKNIESHVTGIIMTTHRKEHTKYFDKVFELSNKKITLLYNRIGLDNENTSNYI